MIIIHVLAQSSCCGYRGDKTVSPLVEVCSPALRLSPPLAAMVAVTSILFSHNPSRVLQPGYLILTCQSNVNIEQHVLTWLSIAVPQMPYHRRRQNPQN